MNIKKILTLALGFTMATTVVTSCVQEDEWDTPPIKCENRYIPDCYKYNTVDMRLAVLRGLMDTDGHVRERDSNTEVMFKSKRLLDDLCEIVESLGGNAYKRKKTANEPPIEGNNEREFDLQPVFTKFRYKCAFLLRKALLHDEDKQRIYIVGHAEKSIDDIVEDDSGCEDFRNYFNVLYQQEEHVPKLRPFFLICGSQAREVLPSALAR